MIQGHEKNIVDHYLMEDMQLRQVLNMNNFCIQTQVLDKDLLVWSVLKGFHTIKLFIFDRYFSLINKCLEEKAAFRSIRIS